MELAAEIHDLIQEDMLKYFPYLKVCKSIPLTSQPITFNLQARITGKTAAMQRKWFGWSSDGSKSQPCSDARILGLQGEASVKLIDTHDHILSAFDRQIGQYATKHFQRTGIELVLGCKAS